jgi:hypothetical protein
MDPTTPDVSFEEHFLS